MLDNQAKLKFIGKVTKTNTNNTIITIFPQYRAALEGVNSFSHVIILYWLHLNDNNTQRNILRVTPRRHKNAPEVGVFASRSPVRPNPIGLSVCQLLEVTEKKLTILQFDAIEGTPIIDIKPYILKADCVSNALNPKWVRSGPKT
jgi:formylmethanofuran dehydrogenase subunit E